MKKQGGWVVSETPQPWICISISILLDCKTTHSHFKNVPKGGLFSESFSLCLKSPNIYMGTKSLPWTQITQGEDVQGSDLAHIFGDLSQSEKLFVIKPPLTLKLAGFWEGFFRRNEVCLIKFSFKWRSKYFIWKLTSNSLHQNFFWEVLMKIWWNTSHIRTRWVHSRWQFCPYDNFSTNLPCLRG